MIRNIGFYGNYFRDFYEQQDQKTQKTPRKEIKMAEKLKKEYYN